MKLDPWNLEPSAAYAINTDVEVKLIMLQLGISDIFDAEPIPAHPECKLIAFDNHPTHWITISRWTGVPEYSPNHGIHKMVKKATANGLFFDAEPKSSTSKATFLDRLRAEREKPNDSIPLSQLPDAGRS